MSAYDETNPILIIEDDKKTASLVALYLDREGFKTMVAHDGRQGLALAKRHPPIFVILDLMLPKLDGWEVCRQLRRFSDVPIIMLTAREEEVDRISGLTLGADDYVVKPFSTRELMVRVKNVLRRTVPRPATESEESIQIGDLIIDVARREAHLNAVELELTTLEFDALYTLAGNAGRVLTREQLIDKVWGYDYYGDTRVVDAVIKRLRSKLREAAPETEIIATVRGVGYKMMEQS